MGACSVLSSSDDFIALEDTAQTDDTTGTQPDTQGGDDSAGEDVTDTSASDTDTDTDADASDGALPLSFLCGVLCSKLASCEGIYDSIDTVEKCADVCGKSEDNTGLGAQFQCWLSIFDAARDRGAEFADFTTLDACPLLDVALLDCNETIQCVSDCSAIEACGKSALISCGFACIENANRSSEDAYLACATSYFSNINSFLAHDAPAYPNPEIDIAAACLLADSSPHSLDIACQSDPCATLCQGVAMACDNHPARLSYDLPLDGPPSEQDLNKCAQRCAARFPDTTLPSPPFTTHIDADTLQCRLGYLALLTFDPTLSKTFCAYADIDGGGVCVDDPSDIDADGLLGTNDPCPYAANLLASECKTLATYCSLASPNCDNDETCNDLSTDAAHCGACGTLCPDASPCDGHGACAQACNTSTAIPCENGFTCRNGYCLWCDASSNLACPQGELCNGIQCDVDQRCAFGACVTAVSCNGNPCAPFETCNVTTHTCECGTTSNSCRQKQDICIGDLCIPAISCNGTICQPGEICNGGGCECDTMRCAVGEFCRSLPLPSSCQSIAP